MSKVDFKLNSAGVQALLKGAEMQAIIAKSTEQVLRAAQEDNPDYASSVEPKAKRVAGTVWADSAHAVYSNRAHNTLEKALRRGKV